MSSSSLTSTGYHCWVPMAVVGQGRLSRPGFVYRNFSGAEVKGMSQDPLPLCSFSLLQGEGKWGGLPVAHSRCTTNSRLGGHESPSEGQEP